MPHPDPGRDAPAGNDDVTVPALDQAEWIRSVVSEHETPLLRYAMRQTGSLDLAREIVQDTFLKLWQQEQAALNGRLAPWLYTVCRNRAIDVRRKERRMQTATDELAQRRADERDPGDAAHAGESARHGQHEAKHSALAALEKLSPRQQEVLRLKFASGLSYREIAEVLDLTVSNVGVIIHHALRAMRDRFDSGTDIAGCPDATNAR